MLYLNEKSILDVGKNWLDLVDVIDQAIESLIVSDYSQPLKPYLRYKDPVNRIIAMPAYVGGNISSAGIKWIASFPNNLTKGLPRAHSVTVLNNVDTGEPQCFINTALVSGVRTAAVSGFVINEYLKSTPVKNLTIGIIGFGVIGKLHLEMMLGLFNDRIAKIFLFDIAGIDPSGNNYDNRIVVCNSWEEAYTSADIFLTCTVSKIPYINLPPKPSSIHLNISLRDYLADFINHVDLVIVDDWDEVCRENTDVENMHKKFNLQEKDTVALTNLKRDKIFEKGSYNVVMVNPMGMAVFDVAVASYYYNRSLLENIGILLPA